MQREPVNLQPAADALKMTRAMLFIHHGEDRKERSGRRQLARQALQLTLKMDLLNGFGFGAEERHDPVIPVDVLIFPAGHVALRSTQVPAELVKGSSFLVPLPRADGVVFARVMARFSRYRTAGHCFLGRTGQSQFMPRARLWRRRRKLLVETVPECRTAVKWADWVSTSGRWRMGSSAVCRNAIA